MSKIQYLIISYQADPLLIEKLRRRKLNSMASYRGHVIIARHGVNKRTLLKLLKKEVGEIL